MSDSSVQSQARHLASELSDIGQRLSMAQQEVPSLESTMVLLETMLDDAAQPLPTVAENLKDIAHLRGQVDDAAQVRAKSLLEESIRTVSNTKEGVIGAAQYRQSIVESARHLVDAVGTAGTDGCSAAIGRVVARAGALWESAKQGHEALEDYWGPKHEVVTAAKKIRKRTWAAKKAAERASSSTEAACDEIGGFKNATDSLQIPDTSELDTALTQLVAANENWKNGSAPLPDTNVLEQTSARLNKACNDVKDLPAAKDIEDKISTAQGRIDKACSRFDAV